MSDEEEVKAKHYNTDKSWKEISVDLWANYKSSAPQ